MKPFLATLAAACFLAAACSHPKATAVAEPPKPKTAKADSGDPTGRTTGRPSGLGLRNPDVVSELPDAGPSATAATPPPSSGSAGTVIARPPTP